MTLKAALASLLLMATGCAAPVDEAPSLDARASSPARADDGNDEVCLLPEEIDYLYGRPVGVPVSPPDAADFFVLSNGLDLRDFDHDHMLKRIRGIGTPFGATERQLYQQWKVDARIRWAVADLDAHEIIAESDNSRENVFAASTGKAVIAAAALWKQGADLNANEWHRLIRLIAESDNNQWAVIENVAGGADGVREFVSTMGYESMQPERAVNRINAHDMVMFMADMHNQLFDGAEALLKIMASNMWAFYRSQTYLPTSVMMGGKTGTYGINNNEVAYLEVNGRRFAIAVLSTAGGSNSSPVALMFGGLAREYLCVQ